MENNKVLIGSIIFVFASFIGMIVLFVYETAKSKRELEAFSAGRPAKARVLQPMPTQDFSMYKTLVGDDNREMVEIPEGPFTMGVGDGGPDEGPAHPVYLQTFYMDIKEVTQSEYERFVKMTKREKPKVPVFEDAIEKLINPDFPVVGLTWNVLSLGE
jgi:formylglycine-generating enzyme required for sulfatase activity